MQAEAFRLFKKLKTRWQYQRVLEKGLLALGVTALPLAFVGWWWQWPFFLFLGGWPIVAFPFFRWFLGAARLSDATVAQWLDAHYPELENSSWLLLSAPPTEGLAKLQQQKVARRLLALPPITVPGEPKQAAVFSLSMVMAALLFFNFVPRPIAEGPPPPPKMLPTADTPAESSSFRPPVIGSWAVEVVPPAYTRQPTERLRSPEVEAPEGSLLRWSVTVDGEVESLQLQFSGDEPLSLQPKDPHWQASRRLKSKGYYRLQFADARDSLYFSDYFPLIPIKDRAPMVGIEGQPAYQSIHPDEPQEHSLRIVLSDDYGLASATLVATVSSGKGEAVKFREARTSLLSADKAWHGRSVNLAHELDLRALGMVPGDELYFYVEATDNKAGQPQRSRTDSYFISLQDTTETEGITLDGLGVDLIPAYFRSQRQLIIDTEALIAKEAALTEKAFKEQSNNIGIDQKILRLRYGKFLGEEFESGVEDHDHAHDHPHHHPDHAHNDDCDHEEGAEEDSTHQYQERNSHERKESGHDEQTHDETEDHDGHDHEAPHGLAHDHDHEEVTLSNGMKIPAGFMHIHDNAEMATLFDEGLRGRLKEALAEMWDAELYLRTGRPREALPHEYKALEIIKEVQRKSRVYVERVGFEPPVFNKAEKRLTGDLADITSPTEDLATEAALAYPDLQKALPIVEKLRTTGRAPAVGELPLLQAAGEALAGLAIEQPGRYLRPLQALQSLIDEAMPPAMRQKLAADVLRGMASAIPDPKPRPLPQNNSQSPLERLYRERINPTP